jgi:hypothetical protein
VVDVVLDGTTVVMGVLDDVSGVGAVVLDGVAVVMGAIDSAVDVGADVSSPRQLTAASASATTTNDILFIRPLGHDQQPGHQGRRSVVRRPVPDRPAPSV